MRLVCFAFYTNSYLCTRKIEPIMTKKHYSAVVFDLDGTLLNTLTDLHASVNIALDHYGMPPRTMDEVRTFLGNGYLYLIAHCVPYNTPDEKIAEVLEYFEKYYYSHSMDTTCPYEGIPELLAELQRRGVRLAVASNKFQAGTEKLIGRYFPDIRFDVVLGQRPDVPLKPDPAVVGEILTATGVAAGEVLYVGDSGVDMQTAAAAGVRSAGVTWGFRTRAELEQSGARHIVDRPAELLGLL